MNQEKREKVPEGEKNCPADVLMKLFRQEIRQGKFPRNIEFNENTIEFWKEQADGIEEGEEHIKFQWGEIEEENLPPLIVKVKKEGSIYRLVYLKELPEKEEKTIIQGKQRKGKNKYGKIVIEKEEDKGEEK